MSKEHKIAVAKLPKSVIRCGPRRMLQHLCDKCGDGKAFKAKNGKQITIPFGEYRVTDKELMKVFGTDRRQTIADWRMNILRNIGDAIEITNNGTPNHWMNWPTHTYKFDLNKLIELQERPVPMKIRDDDFVGTKIEIEDAFVTTKNVGTNPFVATKNVGTNPFVATKSAAHLVEVPSFGSNKTGASEGGAGGVGIAAAQRSAAASSPDGHLHPYYNDAQEYLKGLMEAGYDEASPETITRICSCLEGMGRFEMGHLFNYLFKLPWLRKKTQGRTDWLADRLESNGSRSLLVQFRSFREKAPESKAATCDEEQTPERKPKESVYPEGEIDMSDIDQPQQCPCQEEHLHCGNPLCKGFDQDGYERKKAERRDYLSLAEIDLSDV